MDNLQISNPTGGLDRDKDYSYVDFNDYIDAKNTNHISRDGHTTGDAQTIYGNEYAWKGYLGFADSVPAQNKQIRVAINATANDTVEVAFFTSQTGQAIISGVPFSVVAADIDTSLTNAVANMDSVLSGAGYGNVVEQSRDIDNANFGSVVVSLGDGGTYTGIDFITTFNSINVSVLRVVAEAIPNSLAGENKCIGSFDLLGDLFSWWTTQSNLPDTRDVVGATNATPIVITENTDHSLVDGNEVIIQGVPTNTDANGKWIVNVLTSTTYELV